MSSRTVIISLKVAIPCLTYSCALFSHTSVPWESPDILTNSANVLGFVSISICFTNDVPNSGIPDDPVLESMSCGVTPSASVPLNRLITFSSSSGIL